MNDDTKLYTHREVTILNLKNKLWMINGFIMKLTEQKEILWEKITKLEKEA